MRIRRKKLGALYTLRSWLLIEIGRCGRKSARAPRIRLGIIIILPTSYKICDSNDAITIIIKSFKILLNLDVHIDNKQ